MGGSRVQGPPPAEGGISPFKYALENAASPASREVRSQDGAGEGEGTLVL